MELEKLVKFFKEIERISKNLNIKWNETQDEWFVEIPQDLFKNPAEIYNKIKEFKGEDKIEFEGKYYVKPNIVQLNEEIFNTENGKLYVEAVIRKAMVQDYGKGKEGEEMYKERFCRKYGIDKKFLENL